MHSVKQISVACITGNNSSQFSCSSEVMAQRNKHSLRDFDIMKLVLIISIVAMNGASTEGIATKCIGQSIANCTEFSECFQANNSETCFSSNTMYVFMNNNNKNTYNTSSRSIFVARDLVNLEIRAQKQYIDIHCNGRASFAFINITNLTISGIRFLNCGGLPIAKLAMTAMEDFTNSFFTIRPNMNVTLFLVHIQNLKITNVNVFRSNGQGLLAINILGNSIVTNSHFSGNNQHKYIQSVKNELENRPIVLERGNAVFLYVDVQQHCNRCCIGVKDNYLHIADSIFALGVHLDDYYWYTNFNPYLDRSSIHSYNISAGAGLSLEFAQVYYRVEVTMENVSANRNFAFNGANLAVTVHKKTTAVQIKLSNSNIESGNTNSNLPDYVVASLNTRGGGMEYIFGAPIPEREEHLYQNCNKEMQGTRKIDINISGTNFTNNAARDGGALFIWEIRLVNQMNISLEHVMTIERCHFISNNGINGAALRLIEDPVKSTVQFDISITETIFESNEHQNPVEVVGSTVQVEYSDSTRFINCTIRDNSVTGIHAVQSSIHFEGTTVLKNNNGTLGGGMALFDSSNIVLSPGAQFIITGNYATERGGGIYVSNCGRIEAQTLCFYQLQHVNDTGPILEPNSIIHMQDNKAGYVGNSIYGGNVAQCQQVYVASLDPNETFYSTFNIQESFSDPLQNEIISDPIRLCFCADGIPKCSVSQETYSSYQGEQLRISLVGVGQFGGLVDSTAIKEVYQDGNYKNTSSLGRLDNMCADINFTIAAKETAYIQLYTTSSIYKLNVTVKVNQACPLGFHYNNDSNLCKCDKQFQDHCNVMTGTFERSGTEWIGYHANHTLYHPYCPFEYCEQERQTIRLNESHKQCNFNRTGILCGACQVGLSVQFGGPKCRECTNKGIALILAFAIAGLLLVGLLFILNLTVAQGTINGLIIYANIIRINAPILFTNATATTNQNINKFLYVFIAWLNLDLGIETCFFDGMGSFGKTYMQLLFPCYIWIIAIGIIVACRYSDLVQKWFGSNAVQVLATLFLLSYAKLQRMVIDSLSCTWLKYDSNMLVWLKDGNVQCFQGYHIVLAITVFGFGILFILPVMLFLLFARQLQAVSTRRMFKWVNRLKPLVDAYQGPYKPKFRHWLGVMLFAQTISFASFASNVTGSPAVNFLIIVIVATLIIPWAYRVYKSNALNTLEIILILNLDFLAATSLYIRSKAIQDIQHFQILVTNISVSISFVAFVCIVISHMLIRIHGNCFAFPEVIKIFKRKLGVSSSNNEVHNAASRSSASSNVTFEELINQSSNDPSLTLSHEDLMTSSLSIFKNNEELREPLLETTEDQQQ